MRRGITRFKEHDTAEYMSFVNSNANTLVNNLSAPVFYLISYGSSALVVLSIMCYYSPLLAAVSFVCGALSMILPLRFNKKLGKRIMDRVAWFITFLIAGAMAACGDISVGTLVMFISLFGYFSGSMTIYAQFLPLLLGNKENIKMLLGIIDDDSAEFTGTECVSLEDIIEVRDLSFRYKEEVPVLEHLNLIVHKNEKVALTGPSGCGKSTLIRLLTGTYVNYSGDICYDKAELHDVDRFLSSIDGGLDGDCGENGSHLSSGSLWQGR